MQAEIFQIVSQPLIAWLLALIVVTIVTGLFFRFTSKYETSLAEVAGHLGALGVKFGGPAALFVFLILMTKSYIPDQATVTLKGQVTDEDANPVPNISIVPVKYAGRTNQNGEFSITVPHEPNDQYDVLSFDDNFGMLLIRGLPIINRDQVKIDGFPSSDKTSIVARDLRDQDNNPIDNVRISAQMLSRPQFVMYKDGREATINIQPRKYRIIISSDNNEEIYREDFLIESGMRFHIPSPITVREK